jgi:hypothetical protein
MSKPITSAISFDDDAPTVEVRPPAGMREEVVRAGVLKALGRPPALLRVSVVPLWSDHFRVNVFTGSNESGVVIPNSFFVTADAAGMIRSATPPIVKQY